MGIGNPNIKNYGFGARPREVDDEYRRRIGGVPRVRVWTDERICNFIDELLDVYKKVLIDDSKIEKEGMKLKEETIKDLNTMVRKLLDFKLAYYPPTQKNINLNVDISLDNYVERIEKRLKEKGFVIVEKEVEDGKEKQVSEEEREITEAEG